jgi:Fic family protein
MPDTGFRTTNHIVALVAEINELKGKIEGSRVKLAYKPALQKEAFLRNALGSTAIEGFVLSLPEVKALAAQKNPGRELSVAERAVLNYLAAIRFVQKVSKKPLSQNTILKLHQITAEGTLKGSKAGEYRKIQNYVVDGLGNIIYKPPAAFKVPKLMRDLEKWIKTKAIDYPAEIASGLIHYKFVAIHPFIDGNGRVGRLLGMWELLRRDFDTLHIFSVDDIIYRHKKNYYLALKSASGGDLTGWLEFYLEAVAQALTEAWKRVLEAGVVSMGQDITLTPKQEKTLSLLRNAGRLSVKELSAALKITVQGTHFILKPLQKAGIITRTGGRKTGKYELAE